MREPALRGRMDAASLKHMVEFQAHTVIPHMGAALPALDRLRTVTLWGRSAVQRVSCPGFRCHNGETSLPALNLTF